MGHVISSHMTRSEMLDLVEQWSPVREMFDYRNLVFSHRELRGICCVLIADPTVEQLSYRSYIAIFLLYKCKQR